MGIPQNGCFIMENPLKMDDLEVTPWIGNPHMYKLKAFKLFWYHYGLEMS
jgi:hypothetical protein